MNRLEICQRVSELGLLPVVRAPSASDALALASALFKGGIRCLEITMTVPDAPSVIRQLRARFGNEALVGAGTVISETGCTECLNAGAEFIVSPATLPGLVPLAHAASVPAMIGALTPTEVLTAWQAGSDFVKVFPCSALGGAGYLKALKAPLPDVPLLPTGGVTLETMGEYLAAGAAALGVGGALADFAVLAREGEHAIVEIAKRYVERFSQLRAL